MVGEFQNVYHIRRKCIQITRENFKSLEQLFEK